MKTWGISGQMGAGKSTLAQILEEFGAVNLELDSLGHDLLENPQIKERLLVAFGREILDDQGRVSRKNLGRLAFATGDNKDLLDRIMHPSMFDEVERLLETYRKAGTKLLLINAALLFKMGLDRLCSSIIFVRASEEQRLERIISFRGISPEAAKLRLNAQDPEPAEDDRVIMCDNEGSLNQLRDWVKRILLPFMAGGPPKM